MTYHAPCDTCGKLAQPYMVQPELWNSVVTPTPEFLAAIAGGQLSLDDYAKLEANGALRRYCLECFEARIGRPIRIDDLNTDPSVWINGWMRWTADGRLESYDAVAAWDWAHPIVVKGRQRLTAGSQLERSAKLQ